MTPSPPLSARRTYSEISANGNAAAPLCSPCHLRVERLLRDAHLLVSEADATRWRRTLDAVEWLAIRLLTLDCDFFVHGPPELRAHFDSIHRRTR